MLTKRQVLETGWHTAVIVLALPVVARRVQQDHRAAVLAFGVLAAGLLYHVSIGYLEDD